MRTPESVQKLLVIMDIDNNKFLAVDYSNWNTFKWVKDIKEAETFQTIESIYKKIEEDEDFKNFLKETDSSYEFKRIHIMVE